MGQLETIALVAFCCLGGMIALIAIPAVAPLAVQVLGVVFDLVSGCLQALIGFPVGCGCSCLLLLLLLIVIGAIGLVIFNNTCLTHPGGLCALLGH